ncbi:MAG: TonB-dependent receptor, partial [Pararheinheimera sp.]|nr:TonB-dependent receptor [Rheinheimera sp.]
MQQYKKMKLSKVGLATLFALFGTQQVYAQQQAEATEQNEEAIEKIEVTGSRLKGVDMEGANPLQIFSRDDLAKKGYDSVSAFLRDLPQASSAGT